METYNITNTNIAIVLFISLFNALFVTVISCVIKYIIVAFIIIVFGMLLLIEIIGVLQ